jgi:cobalamin biosynthesis protein CobD/CbiB
VNEAGGEKPKIVFTSGFVFWLLFIGPASIIGGVIAWLNHVSLVIVVVVVVLLLGLALSQGSAVSTPLSSSLGRESKKRDSDNSSGA